VIYQVYIANPPRYISLTTCDRNQKKSLIMLAAFGVYEISLKTLKSWGSGVGSENSATVLCGEHV
jgi:hypothetical protein